MIRILLVADTHLGFDFPLHPRVNRRRRGHDFFTNFECALSPALRGEVDLVVHGGDLLYRNKVPSALLEMAMAPLVRVADKGIPVYLVPGNHERSRIPLHLWSAHPNIHIFNRPSSFRCNVNGIPVVLAGFPFTRKIRARFRDLVNATRHADHKEKIRLLCLHQTVEGAQVGPTNYTFRGGTDVIRGSQIPGAFSVVLAGHIHRAQTLTHDLNRLKLAAPVIYPGSVERTSFAERHEDKGYMILTLDPAKDSKKSLTKSEFFKLPARPMLTIEMMCRQDGEAFITQLKHKLKTIDSNAVVRLKLLGPRKDIVRDMLTASRLREIAPPTMNIDLARKWRSKSRPNRLNEPPRSRLPAS